MRTDDEIAARIRAIDEEDFFGFETGDLVVRLPFDSAKEFLKPEVTPEEWGDSQPRDADSIRAEITNYLPFAFGKALGHRGLSAGRSVAHMRAWFWLLGDDEAVAFIEDDTNYPPYGMPVLFYCADRVGAPKPDDEEAIRMAGGDRCEPSCTSCTG